MADADRVAVITDIHGNLAALEATLGWIDADGIERIFCGGDLVGYGAYPNEVCALLEARAIPTVYGNYDYAIARDLEDCGCAYVTEHDRELGQQSVAWTLAHTGQPAKDFMRGLPFDMHFEVGGTTVHLVHGSPRGALVRAGAGERHVDRLLDLRRRSGGGRSSGSARVPARARRAPGAGDAGLAGQLSVL
jgi:predicted phosphodiesterase